MLSLKTRLVILVIFAAFVHSWWWAANKSPEALRLKAQRGEVAGCEAPKTKSGKPKPVPMKVDVSKYPENWRHIVDTRHGRNTGPDGVTVVDNGLKAPVVLHINRRGADERREAAMRMSGLKPRPGLARDEWPPAMGRTSQSADVRYVKRGPNSGQGSSMGNQLRDICDGHPFKPVAVP